MEMLVASVRRAWTALRVLRVRRVRMDLLGPTAVGPDPPALRARIAQSRVLQVQVVPQGMTDRSVPQEPTVQLRAPTARQGHLEAMVLLVPQARKVPRVRRDLQALMAAGPVPRGRRERTVRSPVLRELMALKDPRGLQARALRGRQARREPRVPQELPVQTARSLGRKVRREMMGPRLIRRGQHSRWPSGRRWTDGSTWERWIGRLRQHRCRTTGKCRSDRAYRPGRC